MSNFNCDQCNTKCLDTQHGYITGCEHYPADMSAQKHYKSIYLATHVSQLKFKSESFISDWHLGQALYIERV